MSTEKTVTTVQAIQLALEHHRAGCYLQAEDIYRQVLNADPTNFDALHMLGVLADGLGKHQQAIELIAQALSIRPAEPSAHNNLGGAYLAIGQPQLALECYRKALELKPDFAEAHFNLGVVLRGQGKLSDAIACYRNALRLRPGHIQTLNSLGNALKEQDRLDLAIDCYRHALALAPCEAVAHHNLGVALKEQGKISEAITCFEQAVILKPDFAEAVWSFHISQLGAVPGNDNHHPAGRTDFAQHLAKLEAWFDGDRIKEGYKAVGTQQPFYLAYQEENNVALLARYGRLCNKLMAHWWQSQALKVPERRFGGPIRVGMVSKHICNHSVWTALVKGWVQHFDLNKFSLHFFYLGHIEDGETLYARSRATSFASGKGELSQWAQAIAEQEIDVLIYPEIGMDPMTARLANLRLAAVQVAAWGHPETTGLPTIDYYLSADDLEPDDAQRNYTETLIKLPHLGCCYQPLDIAPEQLDLEALGINGQRPILICPGMPFKYAPQYDWVLPEIARRLGRCQLVFFAHRQSHMSVRLQHRLRASFARVGMRYEDCVVSIPWQPAPAFFALMRCADVYLDTIGFSGFNSAMQAVQCGLPMVAREGRFMRGRFASGILKRIGLSELVASSEEEYIALAVRLVQDAEYRERIRQRINDSRRVLFDDKLPIEALEQFLTGVARSC